MKVNRAVQDDLSRVSRVLIRHTEKAGDRKRRGGGLSWQPASYLCWPLSEEELQSGKMGDLQTTILLLCYNPHHVL